MQALWRQVPALLLAFAAANALAAPFAYITNFGGNTVSVVDTATNAIVASVIVGSTPLAAAANAAGNRVYVTNRASNTVSLIAPTAGFTVVSTIPVGLAPGGLALLPNDTKVYVANGGSNTVSVIDAGPGTVFRTIPVGNGAHGVVVNSAGTRAYVTNFNSNNVSVIDTASDTVVATIPVGSGPQGIDINPAGSLVYVANLFSNNVSVINTGSNSVIATVSVGTNPVNVAVNASGSRVYVANSLSGNVSVVDTSSHVVVVTVPVGTYPIGLGVHPIDGRIYVANNNSNTVSVLDAVSHSLLATIPVTAGPASFGRFIGGAAGATVPGAPTIGSVVPGNGQAAVHFAPPASNGGAAITSYTVTSSPGNFTASAAASPIVVSGLANGTAYTFTVRATNSIGTGPPSAASGTVTPSSVPATPPGAPAIGGAVAGNGEALVAFSPPASNGGAAITNYTVTSSPGGVTGRGTRSPVRIRGLANGTDYTFTVTATNVVGTGPPSAPSNAVRPSRQPLVAPGQSHTLALDVDGRMFAWGSDSVGQLGQGKRINFESPSPVAGLPPIKAIAAQHQGVAAVDRDGHVWTWGLYDLGERTHSEAHRPGRVLGIANVVEIDRGFHATVVTRADGQVWAWGSLPLGYAATPQRIAALDGLASIAAGVGDFAGVHADGSVYQLGGNDVGQFAAGVAPSPTALARVNGLPPMSKVWSFNAFGGDSRYAGIARNGTVWVWGCWDDLPCSNRTTRTGTVRQATGLPSAARSLTLNYFGLYASLEAGTVHVGYVPDGAAPVFTPFASFAGVDRIEGWEGSIYAIRTDRGVDAAGSNQAGQLGLGSVGGYINPQQTIPGLADIIDVAAGQFFAFALRGDGVVFGFGSDYAATISGVPRFGQTVPLTVSLPGGAAPTRIVAGPRTSLAITQGGALYGWGENFYGTLGLGNGVDQAVPAQLPITNVVDAASGISDTVVVKGDGTVWRDMSPSFERVPGLSDAVRAFVARLQYSYVPGKDASFVLDASGTLFAFGWDTHDSGIFGAYVPDQYREPAPVAGIPRPVVDFAVGSDHALALLDDGTVWAWGLNSDGRLGVATGSRAQPGPVPGLVDIVQVSAGGCHSMALARDGTVWAWGCNYSGELGDGGFQGRSVPQRVASLDNIVHIAAGFGNSFAIRSGGLLFAWGTSANSDTYGGTLGDGALVRRTRPVLVSRENGLGNIDRDDWFLDLQPAVANNRPAFTSKFLATRATATNNLAVLDAAVLPKAVEDIGRGVGVYVLGVVPPEFFDVAPMAPGSPTAAQVRAKSGKALIFVQLTSAGWVTSGGSLIAYTQAVMSASGAAARIASGVPLPSGSRFCIGYGDTPDAMLTSQSVAEVISLEGALTEASGLPCLAAGIYVSGPETSVAGSPVTFSASVVGGEPTGRVQFRDGPANLLAPVTLVAANQAVSRASITTPSLSAGLHSIGASYSGDDLNPARDSEIPRRHEVRAAAPRTSSVQLTGPVSSEIGLPVTFTAIVTGSNPTGTVQFRDGASNLLAAQPLLEGVARLQVSSLGLGVHVISAAYLGDLANDGSASASVSHRVVSALLTGITLASSENPSAFGAPVTLTANVTGTGPTGSVTFRNGAAVIGQASLASGVAAVSAVGLGAGVNVLTATYSGDVANAAVTSAELLQQVRSQPQGTAPNAFAFVSRDNVAAGSVQVSNTITVAGIGVAVPIVVAGGEYSIGCTASFTSAAGMVANGQTVCARHIAAPSFGTATNTTLTIGGVSATFTTTTVTQAFAQGVSQLVTHYYQAILNRAPEGSGQAFWEGEAYRLAAQGVSINETWFVMAGYFFNSAEYVGRNKSDTQFVTDLYNTFFNRPPDTGGLNFWVGQIGGGLPREVVLFSFMFSSEFRTFTQGIFGNTAARPEVDMVVDFFRGLLNRLPDTESFTYWLGRLRTAQCAGAGPVYTAVDEISAAFMFNPEYDNRARSNTQFVTDMYYSFLRRGGDVAGVQYWINQVNAGTPRNNVRYFGFLNSAEFGARVQAVIAAGCLL